MGLAFFEFGSVSVIPFVFRVRRTSFASTTFLYDDSFVGCRQRCLVRRDAGRGMSCRLTQRASMVE
jgi:hypothetical protein